MLISMKRLSKILSTLIVDGAYSNDSSIVFLTQKTFDELEINQSALLRALFFFKSNI